MKRKLLNISATIAALALTIPSYANRLADAMETCNTDSLTAAQATKRVNWAYQCGYISHMEKYSLLNSYNYRTNKHVKKKNPQYPVFTYGGALKGRVYQPIKNGSRGCNLPRSVKRLPLSCSA